VLSAGLPQSQLQCEAIGGDVAKRLAGDAASVPGNHVLSGMQQQEGGLQECCQRCLSGNQIGK